VPYYHIRGFSTVTANNTGWLQASSDEKQDVMLESRRIRLAASIRCLRLTPRCRGCPPVSTKVANRPVFPGTSRISGSVSRVPGRKM